MFLRAFFLITFPLTQLIDSAFSFTNITTFSYPSFQPSNTSGIIYSGNATATSRGVIDLTTNQGVNGVTTIGRATYAKPIRLYDPSTGSVADFASHFTFIIDQLNQTDNVSYEGDGLTFFFSRTDFPLPLNVGTAYLGLIDRYLDGSSSNQIVAVEFDTWEDDEDSSETHMGIDINSITSTVTMDWEFDDTLKLNGEAWVWYNSSTNILFARMINRNLQPAVDWTISWPINLTKVLPELVQVGFTGSATGSYERHYISSWSFTSEIIIPDPPPPPTPNHNNSDPPAHAKGPKNYTKLVLIIVPCVVGLFLIALTVIATVALIRRPKTANLQTVGSVGMPKDDEEDKADATHQPSSPRYPTTRTLDGHPRRTMNRTVESNISLDAAITKFSYDELWEATNGFSPERKLGKGGSGWVYRGILADTHKVVAVKRLSVNSSKAKKQYISEVTIISHLRHPNLVSLIGWCNEETEHERLLVYEYMERGSLDTYLFDANNQQVLPWSDRMRIARDVASAVLYLHEEWVQCVVHRDIKSSNVMIDSDFNARLGDFGLARLVDHDEEVPPQTTVVAGTAGYIAPEYFYSGHVSKEGDVYSLGMLLLEIACGRKAPQPVNKRGTLLVEWVWGLYGLDALVEAVDRKLGLEFNRAEAECMMMVGLWCALPDPTRRPTARDAGRTLRFEWRLPDLTQLMPQHLQVRTVIDASG